MQGFTRFLQGLPGFYKLIQGSTKFNRVLPGFIVLFGPLLGFTGFHFVF